MLSKFIDYYFNFFIHFFVVFLGNKLSTIEKIVELITFDWIYCFVGGGLWLEKKKTMREKIKKINK